MIAKILSKLDIEVWKDIPRYEGLYQVSNLGNVRTLNYKRSNQTKNIKLQKSKDGRIQIRLCKDGVRAPNTRVSQLEAIAFLNHTPCGFKIVVDHIDNDKENNKLYNLQLITNRENCSKDKKNGTSKHTGVCWNKKDKNWSANIYINGKFNYLGGFKNELKAAEAYQNKLKTL
jgi:hypothetical protein